MTIIVGTIKDAGGMALTGILRVSLDAPLVDVSTTPDSIHTVQTREFAISSGVVNVNLFTSAIAQTTYRFAFSATTQKTEYYLSSGVLYTGPRHTFSGAQWTGANHDSDSKILSTIINNYEDLVMDFRAVVPNQASIEFADLLPTGLSSDTLDTSIRRLAQILVNDQNYVQALRGGPRWLGAWSASVFYQRDDAVSYGGSSWVYIKDTPAQGQTPSTINAAHWMLMAGKGDPGGTGGNNTPYSAAGWAGQTDAPSRNAVRDIIQTLATVSQLSGYASLGSPAFTGNPSRATALDALDNSSNLATTAWVRGFTQPTNSPAFTGNPSVPTQISSDISGKIASTQYVHNVFTARNLGVLALVEGATTSQPLTNGVYVPILFTTELYDPQSIVNSTNGSIVFGFSGVVRLNLKLFLGVTGLLGAVDVGVFNNSTAQRIDSFYYHSNVNSAGAVISCFLDLSVVAGTPYSIQVNASGTNPLIVGTSSQTRNRLTIQQLSLI